MRAALIIATVLVASQAALAEVAPTTSPATTQAISNPLKALALHAMAMAAGDPEGVRKFYIANTPVEQSVVNAYASLAGSIFRLQKISKEKFGEHGFELIGFGSMFNDEIRKLQKADFLIQGNRATVSASGPGKPPLIMLLVDGQWKISVAESFPRNPERRAARIRAQSNAYDELASEMAHDRYASADEVKEAGTNKVEKAMKAVDASFPAAATTRHSHGTPQ